MIQQLHQDILAKYHNEGSIKGLMSTEDMSANFLALPRELRDEVYELCLLDEEPINPWIKFYTRQELTPGLLRVSKTIHSEASSLFYAQNRFDFVKATAEDIALFLKTIGRNNAGSIRNIRIDFPTLRDLEPSNITLEKASANMLTNIQSYCTDLRTLTTSSNSTNAMKVRLFALDNPKVAAEALTLVNTRFKAISSLQDIIVEVYEDDSSNYIRSEMENLGWRFDLTEYVEDWYSGGPISDFADDDDTFGYADDNGDDAYDIDDDSDFWRRAGD